MNAERRKLAKSSTGRWIVSGEIRSISINCTQWVLIDDLDLAMSADHALEAILEARDAGLVSHIGITGHGWESAKTHAEALRRFDFATVMTSCNMFMVQNPEFKADWDALMQLCAAKDVGVHVLKATARIAWGSEPTRSRRGTSHLSPLRTWSELSRGF